MASRNVTVDFVLQTELSRIKASVKRGNSYMLDSDRGLCSDVSTGDLG